MGFKYFCDRCDHEITKERSPGHEVRLRIGNMDEDRVICSRCAPDFFDRLKELLDEKLLTGGVQ